MTSVKVTAVSVTDKPRLAEVGRAEGRAVAGEQTAGALRGGLGGDPDP